jgi:hypothetical protein
MQAVASAITSASLVVGGNTLTAFVRKLPIRQEDIDPVAMVVVCPGRPEVFKRLAFGGHYTVEVGVAVAVITPNNGSEGLPDGVLSARQAIAAILEAEAPANGLKVTVDFDPPFDFGAISMDYDMSVLEGRFLLYY